MVEISNNKKLLRIALRNCGLLNPEDIFEYIALGGYESLRQSNYPNDTRSGY